MDLAGHLGMSLRRMLEELDSVEISRWIAYDRLSPLDHAKRAELSAAIIASLVHNAHITKDSSAKAPSEFMQDWVKPWREAPEELPPEVADQRIDNFFNALRTNFEDKK